jgi:hypothetical protein
LGNQPEHSTSVEDFNRRVDATLDKFEAAMTVLSKENSPGVMKIKRASANALEVEVARIGTYFFTCDVSKRYFIL